MGWQTRWASLSARIAALHDAGRFLTSTLGAVNSDYHGIINAEVIPNAKAIFNELHRLRELHGGELPAQAVGALDAFVARHKATFTKESGLLGWSGLQFVVGALTSFRAEFADLLTDTEAVARSLTLRSFVHLQRCMVADPTIRARWEQAFDADEESCEKLGAAHLLGHGIWSFKTSAAGERTDLLLGEPLSITPDIRTISEALVLTEWKRVKDPADVAAHATQALKQARRYSAGILAGFELASLRFLVLVSKDHVALPANVAEGPVLYRYINVAVNPRPPSRR